MKKLKIWFADFWPEIVQEDIFSPILKKKYDVTLGKDNPDIVFHSVFGGMKEINNYPNALKIMWIAENFRPTQFKTDFTISFDPETSTNFRLPLWQAFLLKQPELLDRLIDRKKITSAGDFERFCSFVVSNGNNFNRNGIFTKLNSYKRVHSYGRYMTNDFSLQNYAPKHAYWRDSKDKFFQEHTHKFSICYENSSKKYYCTEKLMDGFLSGSVPIYFGDAYAILDFNEESFINAHRYLDNPNMDIIEAVKRIDSDEKLYLQIRNSPIFTEEQKNYLKENLSNFESWLLSKL